MYLLELKNIYKKYKDFYVLSDISFQVNKGDFLSIIGPSGSGKSTLLHIIGTLDTPTSGEVILNNKKISSLTQKEINIIRRKEIGFIFQFHFLLPEFTALENIIIPQIINGVDYKVAKKKALELLTILKLEHRINHRPSEMSGGEQQRVAIGRAIINNPSIILADEPTGNLDTENSKNILNILTDLNNKGQTIILITHDINIAKKANVNINIVDGKIYV
ncbi:MAG: lipoprotein-releasing system ATP-binding protein LolD [Candidatus Sericytochromatia bacterium]|nr:MAG: lipoprotein-releasing system ATP-binding protein LolD [Candidatus Sericytochromatia bacterium]